MTSRVVSFVALLILTLLNGCKIEIQSPASGRVVSQSGDNDCPVASSCTIEIPADRGWSESFTAVPSAGHHFVEWVAGGGDIALCKSVAGPCLVNLSADLVENDEAAFLTPHFSRTPPKLEAPPMHPVTYPKTIVMETTVGEAMGVTNSAWDRTAAIDVDNDGKKEILVSSGRGYSGRVKSTRIAIFKYDNGKLVDVSDEILETPVFINYVRNYHVADFNGDGIDDVFLNTFGTETTKTEFPGEQNRLLLSDGNGHLVDATSRLIQQSECAHGSSFGDFDGDGSVDIYVNLLCAPTGVEQAYIGMNDGNGNFSFSLGWPSERIDGYLAGTDDFVNPPYYSAAVDFGNDGDIDIYVGQMYGGPVDKPAQTIGYGYLENDGNGYFRMKRQDSLRWPFEGEGLGVADYIEVGDIDKDGDEDIFLFGGAPGKSFVFQFLRNDGPLGFKDVTQDYVDFGNFGDFPALTGGFPHFQLVDIDVDGDLDLAWRNPNEDFSGDLTILLLNDGYGRLKLAKNSTFPGAGEFNYIDMTGDWLPDVAFATYVGGNIEYASVAIARITEPVNRQGWSTNDIIAGGDADDIIVGKGGDDQLRGNGGNDRLIGGSGKDILFGDRGDDELVGGAGNDELRGGAGNNTAIYNGLRSQYRIDIRSPTLSIIQGNGEGRDRLINVQFARFTDETVILK